jgi:hypothetical protein
MRDERLGRKVGPLIASAEARPVYTEVCRRVSDGAGSLRFSISEANAPQVGSVFAVKEPCGLVIVVLWSTIRERGGTVAPRQHDQTGRSEEIAGSLVTALAKLRELRWPRMFGQILRLDKWIVCRG